MGYEYYNYSPRHETGIGMILGVLCWIAVISFIIYMVKRHRGLCHGKHCGMNKEVGDKSALDILKERYAKGEIEKKEFEEIKKDITE